MNDYHCRKCHRWLFASDATYGRVRVMCPARSCRAEQWVFFGGQQSSARPPSKSPDTVCRPAASEPEAACAILSLGG